MLKLEQNSGSFPLGLATFVTFLVQEIEQNVTFLVQEVEN